MGCNTLPEYHCVNINTAANKVIEPKQQGYAHKAFAVIKAAYDRGEAVVMKFASISAANKQKARIATHADEAGFDLMYRRDDVTMYFWLEPKTQE